MDIEEPLPEWAIARVSGLAADSYMQIGAQLCTRDGQRTGNAFVHSTAVREWVIDGESQEIPVAICITDMGNELTLTASELEEYFYPPKYLMDPVEAYKARATEGRQLLWMHDHLVIVEAAKALLSDIEAMQDNESFGPFSNGEMFTSYHTGEETFTIEWPNLAISTDKLKKALEGKE